MKARYLMVVTFALAIGAVSSFADDGGTAKITAGKDGIKLKARLARFHSRNSKTVARIRTSTKAMSRVLRRTSKSSARTSAMSTSRIESGSVPLPAQRSVVTALFSDKFNVDADTKVYAEEAKGGSCLRYKEVAKTLTVEKALSCAEILG